MKVIIKNVPVNLPDDIATYLLRTHLAHMIEPSFGIQTPLGQEPVTDSKQRKRQQGSKKKTTKQQ
jgi:hypothetical protein